VCFQEDSDISITSWLPQASSTAGLGPMVPRVHRGDKSGVALLWAELCCSAPEALWAWKPLIWGSWCEGT
jgi:hypothetical protein